MGSNQSRGPWNKGKLVGQKPPLKPKGVWAIRIHLQNAHAVRDLGLFNLAIDSKLRGCDLVNPHVRDVTTAIRYCRAR
ncbi:phage integrase [Caballeronia telluris]|uniref:Phage integrase n=1 Tax=Caballeronia telluris TaxID=326475 RepID=A0A158JZJ4_9BURK|nr:phage integrase [Caballeronia telluris]